ncbi:DNA-binding transcriptional regulator, XRE-family HTH domain [Carnobacterium iners]|uniref:DNA-binding transcriptional regulator, XRE-family HTH domain n=1 Tax=Carnobacterium iners TaxID=1073423 RepID=A0A1X7MMQ8_9LACT|nr:helix-turn-helix transcriptional regulator [Carnobacterium iners]SEL36231.1 DNA-binding transcriptional regulator, XRE-family HTH domain [Carnobacterium iners]SMH26103.1 DNA-binding transcriptional regulator, XRE-family HTH domain [Carnobacterium iners]SMH26109.1 DNA-binding transcriptional regulator, XRE-family HTH domain [Carnobacterium iners]SMH26116.1 DNA-binding transcriptional regulator, XRE-family HTH domain [Carnobacterium iners]SMH26122.1 DNA-binding transcriptional regulator, XRE-
MEISHEIKKRRTELNITQEELAERLDVTRAAVSNWEVGRNYPDIQLLLKISDELNISLDQLLRGDKTMVSSIDKKIKKGNFIDKYYIVFLTIVSTTLVGYFSFDNWVSTIIFGVISGGIFGVIIDSIGKSKTIK